MWHVWETGDVHKGFWFGDTRGKTHLEGLGIDGMIILKRIFKTWDGTLSNEVTNFSVL